MVTTYAISTPIPAMTPKRCSIAVWLTTSEASPTAVVIEVRKHATAIARTVFRAASILLEA